MHCILVLVIPPSYCILTLLLSVTLQKINSQRKIWHEAWLERQKKAEIQKQEERKRIVLEKAQRDRVKRQESLKRQAADKERQKVFKMRYEEHIAR